MARKKDLGGLAALAGLAYMASRDKEGKGPAPSAPSAAPTAASADTGGDFIEAGSGPSGDFMSEKEPGWESGTAPASKPAAAKAKPVAATASKPKPMGDDQYNADVKTRTAPDSVDVTKLSLAERAKLSRERARSDGTKTDSRSVNERMRDTLGMKKGGSVKGWGIARGSRKAKNY